jgi:hypothetical protein
MREPKQGVRCNTTVIARAACIAVGIVTLACSSPSSSARPPGSPTIASPTPAAGVYLASLGSAGCKPAAAFHGWQGQGGFPEVGIDSSRGSFWALVFTPVPLPTGTDVKVVWRMTGSGPFAFTSADTAGRTASLDWGPTGHGSSDWNHPGDEVGTGFTFPNAGCWNIHVARSDVAGDLWLEVGG